MVEKKTMWCVTTSLEITKKDVIREDGKVLISKDCGDDYSHYWKDYDIIRYFETEEDAKDWIENEKKWFLDMVPKCKKLIVRLNDSDLRKGLGIKMEDYLGPFANDRDKDRYYKWYEAEREYANRLETFIQSRMLLVDGYMINIDQIRDIKWFGGEEAEPYEADEWKAVITTSDGEEYTTTTKEDVRLIWTAIGKCAGTWYIDNDIKYDED